MPSISRRLPRLLFALAATVALVAPLHAGPTRTVRLTSYKDLDEGEAKGTLISSVGEVLPGIDATRADVGELLAYTALRLDGTLYIGTGDQAAVWAARGKDKPKKVAKLDGVLVSALASAKGGRLFAAATPGGRLYCIDKLADKEPRVRELVKLDAEHVWALSYDEDKRTLYAATGPAGKLFAIEVGDLDKTPTAKPKMIWASGEKHLLTLVRAEDGTLLVGSSDQAVLYRVRPTSGAAEVRVVHDFEGEEVRAILRDKGVTYVAVNDFKGQGLTVLAQLTSKSARSPAPAAGGAPPALGLPGAGPAPMLGPFSMPASRDRKGKAAIYRVDDDGRTEQLHALPDGYFTALARDADGKLWAAAGSNGRVYQINADRTVATVLDLPERQVLFLELGGADPMLGTGDSAAVYHLGGIPKDANYLGKPIDAQFTARWGKVRFGGTGVELSTRSGNTQKPDATWTSWQPLGAIEARSNGGAGKIQSPSARFLQVRAHLSGPKSVLRDMTTYYLPQNQRPRVTEVIVGDEALGARKSIALAKVPKSHSAILKIRWKVENPDDDELVYRAFFREEGESNWRPLGGPEPLTKTEYEWNTEALPDGSYLVRVVASDERANPKDEALEHALTSSPVLVDNRKPDVGPVDVSFPAAKKGAQPEAPIANGRAKDAASPITELTYSIDGGDWQPASPKDGVLDDLEESFTVRLPSSLPPGSHTIAVRAVDSADNIGATQITFRVK